MSKTIEQKIAEAEATLARLRSQERKQETGQKVVIGGLVLAAAKKDARIRTWLLQTIEKKVTRDADKKRLASIVEELTKLPLDEKPTA